MSARGRPLRPPRLPPLRRRARGAGARARGAAVRARRARHRARRRAPARRYLERIPVVALDGEELFDFFVDEAELRRRLATLGGDELHDRARRRRPRLGDRSATASRSASPRACRATCRCSRRPRRWARRRSPRRSSRDYTHVNSTQIRRDLSGFGKFGKRGVGYNVDSLVSQIRKILRTSGQHNIALFGAGHLGRAIASSDIFADHGFRVVAIFDADPEQGRRAGRRRSRCAHVDDLRAGRRGGGHRRRRARRPDGRGAAARRRPRRRRA